MVINNRGGYGGQRYNSNGVDNRPYSDGGHFDEAKECDPADWNKPLNRNEKLEQYVLISLEFRVCSYFTRVSSMSLFHF